MHHSHVGERHQFSAVWRGKNFLANLQEEPLRKMDLAACAGAVGRKQRDENLLGRACKGGSGQGFYFFCRLGAAEEGFHAGDFVEVGHASAGVSKWV